MKEGETIVELGVYGIFVGNGFKQLNESAGHLLRAKFTGTDEGGVAAGYACLSSPLLCPDEVLYPMPDEDAEEDEEEEEEEAEENNNEDEDDDDEEDEDDDDDDEDEFEDVYAGEDETNDDADDEDSIGGNKKHKAAAAADNDDDDDDDDDDDANVEAVGGKAGSRSRPRKRQRPK
jgi:hypothetical protein